MINRHKIIFSLIILFLFALSVSQTVLAGGGLFELTAQNRGVAPSKGVTLNIFYGSVDRTTGSADVQFRLKFLNPKPGQNCEMIQAVTNINGFAQGICYSLFPGTFRIYAEYYSSPADKWFSIRDNYFATVYFDRRSLKQLIPLKKLLPLPSMPPLPSLP